jgi:hypothetical protein
MPNMFKDYKDSIHQSIAAMPAVSGVYGNSTAVSFRWDSNSTAAYPIAATTSGALVQQILHDTATNQTYILYLVSTA